MSTYLEVLQGTLLGLFLFLILINECGYEGQENNAGATLTTKRNMKVVNKIHLKYVDDLALAEGINMEKQLNHIPVDLRPQPDTYRARTGHELRVETSRICDQMNQIQAYAEKNRMRLNLDKTKLMLFNPCTSRDFMPEVRVNNTRIELVEESKLLGIIITSDLKWEAHTSYMVQRCNSKIWVIRRLKRLGTSRLDLLDIYCKQIRSIVKTQP